jgi:class 3 adenylate cyclase/tetratricopeptide (TPR) repeat protein
MATELTTTACPRCGAEVPTTARFCPNCGLSLIESPRQERRVVTVLFGDLTGFTEMSERLDAEEVKSIVDRAFEGLAEVVTLYGGYVDKIVGDEIMAVFGAPQAHEDDPERAVRCALEMQRQLATYSHQVERDRGVRLGMRVGVNTGEVIAGIVGGADSYSIIGDAVNAGKRIESSAGTGQILVGERTYLATATAIDYRPHEPIVAKGKAEPLAVWEAVAERALPGEHMHRLEAPLIGRDEERAMLDALAGIVRRDRRSAVATILGSAGMGKSRLADDFAWRLTTQGATVFAGRCLPYGTASPSFAVEGMVRAALDIDPGEQQETAMSRAVERIASLGLVAESERLLGLAGLKDTVTTRESVGPAASGAAPGGRGGDSLNAAASLFEAIAGEQDLVALVFHELHWADDPLLEFVGDLFERAREVPMLLMCLARPELLDRRIPWTGRTGSLVHNLEALPRTHAAELLDALAGQRTIHPAVRESILERAGGNPFFIEELVRLLFDEGGLPAGGAVDAASAVPGTVQAVVSARLDALPGDAKRIAQTASVIGEEFWVNALGRLEPDLTLDAILGALEALVARELVEPVDRASLPNERAFRFRQALVREVAYSSVPKQIRARQHALLASWLEGIAVGSELERELADLIAHHFERATKVAAEVGLDLPEAKAKAREYLERAGERAIGMDAAAAAADFFERALEYARDEPDRLHLQLHLGEALVGCWRPVEAELHLTQALDVARRLGDRKAEAKALRLLGDLMRMRGDTEQGRKHLADALEIAREVGDPLEEAEGLRSHGLSDLFQGRLSSAVIWFRRSMQRFEELGDRRGVGWNLVNLAWADLLLGQLEEANGFLSQGIEIFSELGDAEGVGWCLGLRAWVLLFQGKLAEAEALQHQIDGMIMQSMRPTPRGMGSFGWAIGRVCLSFIALDRARLGQSIELARQGLAVFEESDAVWGLAMGRFPMGVAQLLRLQIAEARETLSEGVRQAERASDPMVKALLVHGSAMVEFFDGLYSGDTAKLDEALRLNDQSMALTEGTGVSWISDVPGRTLKAEILRERGRFDEALATLDEVVSTEAGLYEESRASAVRAETLNDMGRAAEAIEAAGRGMDDAGEDVCGSAMCHRAKARGHHVLGDHAEAERLLREEFDVVLEASDWDEERVHALALLAEVLDAQGRHDEAGVALDEGRALLRRFPAGAPIQRLESLLTA